MWYLIVLIPDLCTLTYSFTEDTIATDLQTVPAIMEKRRALSDTSNVRAIRNSRIVRSLSDASVRLRARLVNIRQSIRSQKKISTSSPPSVASGDLDDIVARQTLNADSETTVRKFLGSFRVSKRPTTSPVPASRNSFESSTFASVQVSNPLRIPIRDAMGQTAKRHSNAVSLAGR